VQVMLRDVLPVPLTAHRL